MVTGPLIVHTTCPRPQPRLDHLPVICIEASQLASSKKTAVIIVAAGRGTRAGTGAGNALPKQYRPIRGVPLLARTIAQLLKTDAVDLALPVIHADDVELYSSLKLESPRLLPPCHGGETRQLSVLAGLEALTAHQPDYVLIHDAARPFVSDEVIKDVVATLGDAQAVLPVTQVIDTIKRSADGRTVGGTEDRTQLYAAQTPQGFHFTPILDAHRRAAEMSDSFTDDAAIAEWAHIPVAFSTGSMDNIKITGPEDFARAEHFLERVEPMETRVGTGYDVHQFIPGTATILGGVTIPHSAKLKGHSDADAALHVLTDALLGAMADGDIGTHFPPSDPKWKGEPSPTFLSFAVDRVKARKGRIVHLDLTIMCEQPKIGPHAKAMRESIANICGVNLSRVSVKATTSEKMGFVGRQEGIITMATATIELPRGQD